MGSEGLPLSGAVGPHLPVGDRYEILDIDLPIDQEGKGRGLDPSHGQEVRAHLGGCHGDESGEYGAPHQVDDLPGLAGRGEGVVHLHRLCEGRGDLLGREGGESGPEDGYVGVLLEDHGEGLDAYELALAVIVGGDDDPVRLPGELAKGVDDVGGLLHLYGVDIHQAAGGDGEPVVVLVGIVEVEHVAAEPNNGHVLARVLGVPVYRDPLDGGSLGAATGQDVRYPPRGVILLRDD